MSACKVTFGAEPMDKEIMEFIEKNSAGIGVCIGYGYHWKAVNAAQEILDDIEMN